MGNISWPRLDGLTYCDRRTNTTIPIIIIIYTHTIIIIIIIIIIIVVLVMRDCEKGEGFTFSQKE